MQDQVVIIKNFINKEICNELNKWVEEGVNKNWLDKGKSVDVGWNCEKRLTTRNYGNRFQYPKIAFEVFDYITKFLKIDHLEKSVFGGGRNGVVVSYIKPGGDVNLHIDPLEPNGHILRCNLVTQSADDGGELFVDDKKINIEVGDLHFYLASKIKHYVTEVKGNTPRILWMFGYQCSLKEFESIRRNHV